MTNIILPLMTLKLFSFTCAAQSVNTWHGKKCAAVLTYDDAINQHLDNAIPFLIHWS
jgi:peptidoglycan-N-acetylglucosamine deacetylase